MANYKLAALGAAVLANTAHALRSPTWPKDLGVALVDDVETVAWSSQPSNALLPVKWSGYYPKTNRPYNGTMGILYNISLLSVQLPDDDGCANHQYPSITAAQHDCQYAVNAGFFTFPPNATCEGNLIINGTTQQYLSNATTNFGVSSASKSSVFGYVTQANASAYKFDFLVSGNGWLVRSGQNYVNQSRELDPGSGFVTEKAPRTAVYATRDGTVIMLTVDGIETENVGADLYEFADLLIESGAYHAVNLDGGGSTTAVFQGQVYNQPHCSDVETVCERNVTSIICARYPH